MSRSLAEAPASPASRSAVGAGRYRIARTIVPPERRQRVTAPSSATAPCARAITRTRRRARRRRAGGGGAGWYSGGYIDAMAAGIEDRAEVRAREIRT